MDGEVRTDRTFEQVFSGVKTSLNGLYTHTRDRGSKDPDVIDTYRSTVSWISALPREQLVRIASEAVAQRNSDAVDQLDEDGRKSLIFSEEFLLSVLSPAEEKQVLENAS